MWYYVIFRDFVKYLFLWHASSISLVFSLVFRIHIPDEDWNVHQHFHIYLLNRHCFPHENFRAHEIHACLAQCLIWHHRLHKRYCFFCQNRKFLKNFHQRSNEFFWCAHCRFCYWIWVKKRKKNLSKHFL